MAGPRQPSTTARRAMSARCRGDAAEIGIGTMIVFIAAVIVAAVAAAVLITTSGELQEKASRTGREATQQVSSNIFVREVTGEVGNNKLQNVTFLISVAPGSSDIDLSRLILRWVERDAAIEFNLTLSLTNATAANSTTFLAREAMTVDNDPSVLRSGDLVKLTVFNRDISPRTEVSVTLLPELGAPVRAGFRTPPSFGLDRFIVLS